MKDLGLKNKGTDMRVERIKAILLREIPIYYLSRIVSVLPNHGVTCKIRGAIVSPFLKSHGSNFQLAQGSIINHPEGICVGKNVYFAHRIYINGQAGLEVGDNVTVGPNCIIVTGNHSVKEGQVCNEGHMGKVTIGAGTWIGGNVTITPGVNIGRGCIIGAGAVVTKDIPSGTMAVGVPAKPVKQVGE